MSWSVVTKRFTLVAPRDSWNDATDVAAVPGKARGMVDPRRPEGDPARVRGRSSWVAELKAVMPSISTLLGGTTREGSVTLAVNFWWATAAKTLLALAIDRLETGFVAWSR
jgi:hypothetical protein